MAGYSGTLLPKKLGMKAGMSVMFVNPPAGFDAAHEWPAIKPANMRRLDFVILFAKTKSQLSGVFDNAAAALPPEGILWVAWPKRASGAQTDLGENEVREYGLKIGLVDVKVCAIDETWSGLKFVVPAKDRDVRRSAKL